MNGVVDEFGRALITLGIRANSETEPTAIQAWIDTAFNGELVMPRSMIQAAQLEQTAGIEARLADGNEVMLESFTCILDWFGADLPVEVIANDGPFPLLGVGLLIGHRLVVDYPRFTVAIEPHPAASRPKQIRQMSSLWMLPSANCRTSARMCWPNPAASFDPRPMQARSRSRP